MKSDDAECTTTCSGAIIANCKTESNDTALYARCIRMGKCISGLFDDFPSAKYQSSLSKSSESFYSKSVYMQSSPHPHRSAHFSLQHTGCYAVIQVYRFSHHEVITQKATRFQSQLPMITLRCSHLFFFFFFLYIFLLQRSQQHRKLVISFRNPGVIV